VDGRTDQKTRHWRRTGAWLPVARIGLAVLLAVLIVLVLIGWRLLRPQVLHAYDTVPVFRLHVVAHSDAPADQDMKLAVRDAVLPLVLALVDGAQSPAEAYQRLAAAQRALGAAAQAVVRSLGAHYPVAVETELDPAGQPAAVRIVIGAGRGANWFCVLFPPLCFADGSNAIEPVPASPAAPAGAGMQLALRWLDWLPGLSSLLLDGVGQVHQDDVHAYFAHALPGNGHVRPAAE